MSFLVPGWKKKAEHLRMVIVAMAPDVAKELPPSYRDLLEGMRDARRRLERGVGDVEEEVARLQALHAAETPARDQRKDEILWEPMEIYGWRFSATLYIKNGALWWLLGAGRKSTNDLTAKERKVLEGVIAHLGGDVTRDVILMGELDFNIANGVAVLWTWPNTFDLFEIQVHGEKKDMRVVPRGTRASDGYEKVMPTDRSE